MSIKKYESVHEEAVHGVLSASLAAAKTIPEPTKDYLENLFTREGFLETMSSQADLFVYLKNQTPVGLGGLRGQDVILFYVHPDHQREGIGSKLLTHVEGIAWSHSLARIIAHATHDSFSGLQKLGWEHLGEYTYPNEGVPYTTQVMCKWNDW